MFSVAPLQEVIPVFILYSNCIVQFLKIDSMAFEKKCILFICRI